MRRTIEVKNEYAYYRGKEVGELVPTLQFCFKLRRNGKYLITITKGTDYWFRYSYGDYNIYSEEQNYMGFVCSEKFNKLFFTPNKRERYNITVKKVKKK